MNKISNKIVLTIMALLAIGISSWALVPSGFFRVHDFTQAARISEMARILKEGQWPPYWVQNLGYGYGMPLFEFYAPLPYLTGAVFYLITNNVIFSIKFLYLFCNVISLVGMYLFARRWFGFWASILSSLLFALAPYRALDLYIRGAVSESWGIAILPWVFLGLDQILRKTLANRFSINYVFCLSIAALILSHNLSAIMALPFLAIYACFLLIRLWRQVGLIAVWRGIITSFFSGMLGLGISAFYWLPALLEKQFTKVDSYILGGYFDYHLHFLYIRELLIPKWGYGGSGWGPNKEISFFLGYGVLAVVIICVLLLIYKIFKNIRQINKGHFLISVLKIFKTEKVQLLLVFLVMTLFAIWLTLFKSEWLWALIKPWQYIQFPWRWLGIAIFCLSLFSGGLIELLCGSKTKIVLFLISIALISHAKFFAPEKFLQNSAEFYYTDESTIRANMSSILPDYIPIGLSDKILPATKLVVSPSNDYSILLERAHEKLVQIKTSAQTDIIFAVANYPGWVGEIDGQPITLKESDQGLIVITVPSGNHLVGLRFGSTPIRQISIVTSILTATCLVILTLKFRKINHDR